MALAFGPCMAHGAMNGEAVFVYRKATWITSQLLGGENACDTVNFEAQNAGGRVREFGTGLYQVEGFACDLRPGSGLQIPCSGGTVAGIKLPDATVEAFEFDGKRLRLSGVMRLEDYSYCFSLKADEVTAAD